MKNIILASLLSLTITLGGYIGVVKMTAKRKLPAAEEEKPLTKAELAAAEMTMQGMAEQKVAMIQVTAAYNAVRTNLEMARAVVRAETEKLRAMHASLDSLRAVAREENEASLSRVAKLYEQMKPAEAARIAGQLSTDLLVEIIPRMKPRAAGKLLSAMDSKRAAEISRRLAAKGGGGKNS